MISFTDVNLVAVLVAVVLNMLFGMIWYSPMAAGKAWMRLTGMTDEKAKTGMQRAFMIGISATIIGAYFTAVVLHLAEPSSLKEAMTYGVLLILAFVLPIEMHAIAWEQRPTQLLWINATWGVVSTLITVAVLYSWA